MAHHCGFTLKALLKSLRRAGFKSIGGFARPRRYELWALASKEKISEAELKQVLMSHIPP